jgi:hypothetical protein
MQVSKQTTSTHRLERFLAILGAVVCLIITIPIWWSLSAYQSMWLLPGFYFLEMVLLSILNVFMVIRVSPHRGSIIWATVGVFITFSVLGAFSVGFFYLPVALIFAVLAITLDVRNKQPVAEHLGICLIAGLAQAAMMFAAIRLLYPTAVF